MARPSLITIVRLIAFLLTLVAINGASPASAHPELERTLPAADALLAAPTNQIDLWFTERIDIGAGSPTIELIDENGERFSTTAQVDPADATHVIASTSDLNFGTWTVAWQVRSLDDGHTLTGSFAFRIGGSTRAPGAATTEGERPQAWNVATRWATFLGAAMTAGAAVLLLLSAGRILRRTPIDFPDRARPIALIGAVIATLATYIEPWLLTRYPPANTLAPTLSEAFDIQPAAWMMRVVALAAAVVFASIALFARRSPVMPLMAGASALVGIFGLSLTGHAAARNALRPLAIAVDTIHQWSIALWIGALLVIVFAWRAIDKETIDRFSFAALPLILVGILAGVINSVFALPALSALWSSDYGRVIIAKVVVLVGVLLLALKNRSIVMRFAKAGAAIVQSLRVPMRAEGFLAIVVVLGGSILSLMAPPTTANTSAAMPLAITHFSAPAPREDRFLATLHIDPAKPGANDIGVSLTDLDNNAIPNDAIQRITLDFTSLTSQTSQTGVATTPGDDGIWRAAGLQLTIADWWRVTAHIRRAGVEDTSAVFYLVLPDPNVGTFPDTIEGDGNPAAEALFQTGLTSLTSLHRVSYSQQIATGSEGQVVFSLASVNDGTDGSTPAQTISTEQSTSITIGTTRWLSQTTSGRWGATQSNPPILPSEWGDEYENAVGFRLGAIEEVNGIEAQIVTFYTPQTQSAPAYFAWWVSTETGQLLQIAMVSRVHYMTQVFFDFDGHIVIEPPVNAEGTPVATPGLDISNLGG